VHREGIIAVYILASQKNGTLYTGMTSDLSRRAFEHREGALGGFTKRYGVRRLVWYEGFELITAAMQRERSIKGSLDSERST
jgi:putative endonuclease